MSGPIKYTDNQGGTVFVKDNGDYGCIDMATDDPEQGHVHVRGPMRQKIAQALAGGGYMVVATPPGEVREQLEISRIDVRQEGDDLIAGSGPEVCSAKLVDNPNWLYHHARNALALYRELKRRAEPEPDPEQVEALAVQLEATWASGGQSFAAQARQLVRRGVTVRKDT